MNCRSGRGCSAGAPVLFDGPPRQEAVVENLDGQRGNPGLTLDSLSQFDIDVRRRGVERDAADACHKPAINEEVPVEVKPLLQRCADA